MKNKSKQNGFDSVFESVYNSIVKTKNYHLVLDDRVSTELLTFFLQNILDINNYYLLYKNSFIPAANKSVSLTKAQYRQSKYRALINASNLDLKENLFETIRLGYVGLFHKIEGFTKGIRKNNSLLIQAYDLDNEFNLSDYLNSVFDVDFLNPVNVHELNKIRVISNAVKHNNGFLQSAKNTRDDILNYIPNISLSEKICLETPDFLTDIKTIIDYFQHVNTIVNVFTMIYITEREGVLVGDFEEKKKVVVENYRKLVRLYCRL